MCTIYSSCDHTTNTIYINTTVEKIIKMPVEVEKIVYQSLEVEKIVYQSCEDDPMGNRTKNWGRSGHSHCQQPYSWTELIKGYKDSVVPYKVGGLGKLLEPHAYETWVCLEDAPCGDPQYCWVYHETNKVFTPWGTNGELRLVKA